MDGSTSIRYNAINKIIQENKLDCEIMDEFKENVKFGELKRLYLCKI